MPDIQDISVISSTPIECPFCGRKFILERYANAVWLKHEINEGAPFGECDCGATFYDAMQDLPFDNWDDDKQQEFLSQYDSHNDEKERVKE